MSASVATTCPYCGVGCGVIVTPTGGGEISVAGDKEHPANAGRLCSKGTNLDETVGMAGRLLHPMIGDDRATWDEALDLVAERFRECIERHGPDSVAFYVSGQLLTEDYYVANKLMKGFIGSANIDTNSRLCMSSAVAAHVRAFGEDLVPVSYDDLEQADLIVLTGSNTAWCHPIVWQRIEAARSARGARLVVIDPRRTETAEQADLHLQLRPGSDVALFNGLLQNLRAGGGLDEGFLAASVNAPEGFWETLEQEGDPAHVAECCDLPMEKLVEFFDLFARRPRAITLFSQGVNQSLQGTDKANAIINVHLATGRIGKPGAGPFSITGQPNAMGGREVGGLANMLAAHMDFAPEAVARVARFWDAPAVASKPGLKAVDLFRAVGDGRIKALWVMGTNPAVSMPDASAVRAALAECPFVVVSDVMAQTDTARFAHVRLPAAAWGEKAGTVTNSERNISRQRPFRDPPGEARTDWRIIADVARRMGHGAAFAWRGPHEIFAEHCRLTMFENDGARALHLGDWVDVDEVGYEDLSPRRWGGERLFEDGRFQTPDGRARLIATVQRPLGEPGMTLNTGRYRDQWHTMTRTGLSPRLSQHRREPLVEIHPEDARARDLNDGDLARVATAQGASVFRVQVTDAQRRGDIFVPIHWTDQTASEGRAGRLPAPDVDPISGQPGFKLTAARIARTANDWRGFMITSDDVAPPETAWWTSVTIRQGRLFLLAGDGSPAELERLLPPGERLSVADTARGALRVAVMSRGRLVGALFTSTTGTLPDPEWLIGQVAEEVHPGAVLAGRPPGAAADRGAIICACFNVGARTILQAVVDQRLTTVAEVSAALSAGTNCGSCRPAIAKLIAS